MEQTKNEVIANLLADLSQEYKQLRVDMRSSCITSTPYIVVIGGLFIDPEVKNHKTTRKHSWNTNPLAVRRFCFEDADMIAKGMRNGNGDCGKAVGIYQAVRARHVEVKNMMSQLRSL